MEDKLPDDQLEHFLRNSLKDHSEKPSEDVWDKIDYSLDRPMQKAPSTKKWIWMSAAAVAGIILYLGANNIYLNNKLKKAIEFNKSITHQQPDNTSEKPEIKNSIPQQDDATIENVELNKDSKPMAHTDLNSSAVTDSKSTANKDKVVLSPTQTQQKVNPSKPLIPSIMPTKESQTSDSKAKNQIAHSTISPSEIKSIPSLEKQKIKKSDNRTELTENQNIKPLIDRVNESIKIQNKNIRNANGDHSNQTSTETAKLNQTKSDKIPSANIVDKKEVPESVTTILEEKKEGRSSFDLVGLPQIESPLSSLSGEKPIHPSVLSEMIPVKIPVSNHWVEWNLHGGIIQESGSLVDLRRPNNSLFTPAENTFATINSWIAGLGYSKSLNKNLFVSTGLAFKNYEIVNTINQSLSFGGRNSQGPGSLPFQHDWNFKLNCPGGTSNIMIQSEQLDSRATISDNEQVKVNITNTEKLNYLTIPLALNYRTTFGKISLMAGAGLHMNILTTSSFEDPAIKINHPQLKTRNDSHFKYRFDKSNLVVWNGALSAGVSYAIAPKLSLQLTPSWFIPITNRNSDRDVKVNSSSVAFQLGLNYSIASL